MFKHYVINWNTNKRKAEMFNVFDNCTVHECTEKIVKKYLRAPSKYTYENFNGEIDTGFEGFCKELLNIIKWQEWGRCEYEIAVGSIFTTELRDILPVIKEFIAEGKDIKDFKEYLENQDKRNLILEKWDCYDQCVLNIEEIAREVIYQYREYLKKEK